ncbi:FHA domain-containing protein [Thermosynechococcaceae cyanobacterium Okahandja]
MAAPAYRKAWLTIREYGQPKREVVLNPDRQWTIGRQQDCRIRLSDRYVSRVHAVINSFLFAEQPLYYIADCHSRNGTLLNSLPLQHSALLHHEDVIVLGRTLITFHYPEMFKEVPAAALAELKAVSTSSVPWVG